MFCFIILVILLWTFCRCCDRPQIVFRERASQLLQPGAVKLVLTRHWMLHTSSDIRETISLHRAVLCYILMFSLNFVDSSGDVHTGSTWLEKRITEVWELLGSLLPHSCFVSKHTGWHLLSSLVFMCAMFFFYIIISMCSHNAIMVIWRKNALVFFF